MILTLWMVSSRPSASILPGAAGFGAWWGTPESKKIARQADIARRVGNFDAAEATYRRGYDDAVLRRDELAMVGYLNGIAACRLAQSRYRAALEVWLEAKTCARKIGDRVDLGAIAVNLSTLYSQVWDFESAQKEAEEGRAAARSLKRPYFLPSLLLQLARLHDIREHDDGTTADLYREGIRAARAAADKPLEALGLDLLGQFLVSEERQGHKGHLEEARQSILDAMHLREKFSPRELGFSWGWMGDLKLVTGELDEAARYTELALNSAVRAPEYLLKHQRGEIRAAMGDHKGALSDFEAAVSLVTHWRLGILPANSSFSAANEALERRVFSSFIETAAREGLRTGDPVWARKAFGALELNRAASLRESLALSEAWHRKVPPQYWETLANIRAVDSRMLGKGSLSEESRSLRLELAEMEAKAGLGFTAKNSEIFLDQSSLIHFQQGLSGREVLLSFHLGDTESYLWAVTKTAVLLQKIAARGVIRSRVSAWKAAVRTGRPEAVELGEELYKELFGQLQQETAAKPSWLLSLEGTLFEVPFAALVTERKGGEVSYLISQHSVQTIPGALLLSARPETGTGWFLGVGDPIYNVADPRWREQTKSRFFDIFKPLAAGSSQQFGRLVGSSQELSASAANWSVKSVKLLEGTAATRERFLEQLGDQPSVIHLATHVIASTAQPQPFIAFGLGPKGQSDLLTMTDVASLTVPGAVVVMSGCDSGWGEARDGTGLQGLARAWQMAGAGAVLTTSWQVRDSTGDIFASFYKYLREVPAGEALRLSQLEMIHSGTWRAAPSYWASYQITGSVR